MLRVALWTAFLLLSVVPLSHAGFEWVPPQENPQQSGMNAFDFDIAPPPVADRVGSRTVIPVYQEPLTVPPQVRRRMEQPAPSIMPEYTKPDSFRGYSKPKPQRPLAARAPERSSLASLAEYNEPNYYTGGLSPNYADTRPAPSPNQKPSGLFIDPFPMGSDRVNTKAREMNASSIEQAMMEKVEKVHGMPLGNGMETGAQIAYADTPTVKTPATNPIINMSPNSITPVGTMGSIQSGPVNAAPVTNYKMAEGFGADLPLALAISQVIPAEFKHTFALGVDPGTTVSWQGGKAWNVVLEDMLRPNGLTAEIRNNTVTIKPVMSL